MNELKEIINSKNQQLILPGQDVQAVQPVQKNVITNNTQNNTQNNQLNFISFEKTTYDHLTDEDFKECLQSNRAIAALVEKVHFNPNRPQNQTVYVNNYRSGKVVVYKEDKWTLTGQKEVIDDLVFTHENMIDQWCLKHEDDSEVRKMHTKFNNSENDKCTNETENEVHLSLYNNRDVAKETRKKIDILVVNDTNDSNE